MRKECRQTHENSGLMQALKKGGWKRRAKKAIASVMAVAMVVTSGAVVPQNATVAEAATNVGASDSLLGWGAYSNFYDAGTVSGDFSASYSFHAYTTGTDNWVGPQIGLTTNLSATGVCGESDGTDLYVRPDVYADRVFTGATQSSDYGTVGDWTEFNTLKTDSDVTIDVLREGTTITVSMTFEKDGDSRSWVLTVTNCPTDDLKIFVGGNSCYLENLTATAYQKHNLTVNYVYAGGGTAAESVTQSIFENSNYSIVSPEIDGYTADVTTVAGTMPGEDKTVTVTYTGAAKHTVTVEYQYENGTEAATSQSEEVDETKGYSITSPTVDGYCADRLTVTGTMGTEDKTETVIYKKVIDTVGTANTDGSYTLGFNTVADYHYVPVGEGDFNVTFAFHQAGKPVNNWDSYAVVMRNADATLEWYERADLWDVSDGGSTAFGNLAVTKVGGPNWDTYQSIAKDAEVTVTITRSGTDMSIAHTVTGANGLSYTWTGSITGAPTEALSVWLGGEACQLSIYEVSGTSSYGAIEKHKVTLKCVKADGTTSAHDDVVEEFYPGETYTVAAPDVEGFAADPASVTGTMGASDVTETITYTSVDAHTLTINYVYEDDTEAAETYTASVDEGKTYSVTSPTVAGYIPDKKVVEGTMAAEDVTITVTYSEDKAIARIGTDNGDGTYTLGFNDTANYYKKSVAAGDFSVGFKFHNLSAGTQNYLNYIMSIQSADSTQWVERADNARVGTDGKWGNAFNAIPVTATTNANFDTFKETLKDSEVTLIVSRVGTDMTIKHVVTGANGVSHELLASATGCPTGAMDLYLGGENCYLELWSVETYEKHNVTVDYQYADGTKAAESVTKEVYENNDYAIESPSLDGYSADVKVVEGTMGTEDVTVTVTYSEATAYTLTINYVNAGGKEMASSVVATIDEGKEYSYKSPVVSSGVYQPDKNVVKGIMPSEDLEITVTYRYVKYRLSTYNEDTAAYEGGWWLYGDNGIKIKKSKGDFKASYSFHSSSTVLGSYASYGIGITTNLSATAQAATDLFMTSAAGTLSNFGSSAVFENDYAGDDNWATFNETIQDADMDVEIKRTGTTIVITTDIKGANGKEFHGTATFEGCPTSTVNIFLTADWCDLAVYSASESDIELVDTYGITVNYVYEDGTTAAPSKMAGPYVEGTPYHIPSPTIEGYVPDKAAVTGNTPNYYSSITVTYSKKSAEVISTVGSIDADGNPYLAYNDLASYYNVPVSEGDFEVDFAFNQKAKASNNWEAYAIIVRTADGSEWYHRADLWSNSDVGNTAFGGKAVSYDGSPVWGDNFATYQETMKDADITIKVTRVGTKMVITHSVFGANGVSYSYTSTVDGCPTDGVSVYLGGEMCQLTLNKADVNGEASTAPTPTEEPTAAPTEEPSVEPTAAPTEEPSAEPTTAPTEEPSAEPTTAPVEEGDKVTDSNGTFKVTDTEKKTVTYTVAKKSNKKTVSVPDTVTVDGKKYKVTAIAKNAFKNNKKVEKIVVSKNITKIDANAFKNCKKLTTLVIKSTKIKSVAKNALKGTNKKLVIKVPAKKVAAYKKLFAGKGNNSVVIKKA